MLKLSPSRRARREEVRELQQALTGEVPAPLDATERRQLLELLGRLKEGPIRGAIMQACWDDAEHQPEHEE